MVELVSSSLTLYIPVNSTQVSYAGIREATAFLHIGDGSWFLVCTYVCMYVGKTGYIQYVIYHDKEILGNNSFSLFSFMFFCACCYCCGCLICMKGINLAVWCCGIGLEIKGINYRHFYYFPWQPHNQASITTMGNMLTHSFMSQHPVTRSIMSK